MKGIPLSDRILVAVDTEEERIGSIIVGRDQTQRPLKGTVVAVGPGRILETGQLVKMTLQPGDKILFGKFSGMEVRLGDQGYLVMSEPDVMLKIVE